MIYLDSNVFIYSKLDTEFSGRGYRSILSQVQNGQIIATVVVPSTSRDLYITQIRNWPDRVRLNF